MTMMMMMMMMMNQNTTTITNDDDDYDNNIDSNNKIPITVIPLLTPTVRTQGVAAEAVMMAILYMLSCY